MHEYVPAVRQSRRVAVSPCCRDSLYNSRISAKRRCCAPTALYNSRKRAKYTCCTVT
ncbi:hypothetical protein BIFBIF_02140 [Bifidobacterium bifidum ATCC 29521 = JCM 1255 = DSM 20456]|nr:hypothetical protein BIFBIF_02140 [Bifidobacterium bifidum ATCC 29521 = JCM 1255 = DSM 20456]